MAPPKTLSELREWHSRLVENNEQNAIDCRAVGAKGNAFFRKAEWHRAAVNVLDVQINAVIKLERIAANLDRIIED